MSAHIYKFRSFDPARKDRPTTAKPHEDLRAGSFYNFVAHISDMAAKGHITAEDAHVQIDLFLEYQDNRRKWDA